jgi:hypothetical protein
MAQFAKRAFGKGEIDRAGQLLNIWWNSPGASIYEDRFTKAFVIAENWRARTVRSLSLDFLVTCFRLCTYPSNEAFSI